MKKKLFLDFDSTIVNTLEAFCKTYNQTYFEHPKFEQADWKKIREYNITCQCPILTKEQRDEIFDSELLFANIDFFPNAYEVIKKLNEQYDVYICSIGTVSNLSNKMKWLEKNLPFIKNYIMLKKEHCEMGKSIVNMKNGILIDDNIDNLITSNAEDIICFGKVYNWNNKWSGLRFEEWNEIKLYLIGED